MICTKVPPLVFVLSAVVLFVLCPLLRYRAGHFSYSRFFLVLRNLTLQLRIQSEPIVNMPIRRGPTVSSNTDHNAWLREGCRKCLPVREALLVFRALGHPRG